VDGGARRRDKLAAIGYQIRKGPFKNTNAVYPNERDGTQVAAGEFQVEYPAKDETDSVECELTSAAVALFVLFEQGEYLVDLYGLQNGGRRHHGLSLFQPRLSQLLKAPLDQAPRSRESTWGG
jgi:hypothetical protein